VHYIYHKTRIKYIYDSVYDKLLYVDTWISNYINKYIYSIIISQFIKKATNKEQTKPIINYEFITILQNNLKLINYIEGMNNLNNQEIQQLIFISKISINKFIKKHINKQTEDKQIDNKQIIDMIKLHNK